MRNFLLILGALVLLAGCAAAEQQNANETSMVLSQAGFQVQTAKTPAQKQHLDSLPQRKVFKLKRQGQDWYVFADAKGCNCLYIGDYVQYQRYKSYAWNWYMQTGQERLDYISGDSTTSGGWNDWGPW